MFMGAMLGVVLVDNVIVLYMFWELTSLSSFLLIGYWHKRKKSRYGAEKSLLITVGGGLCMLGGFILLYLMTDSFSIRKWSTRCILSQAIRSLFRRWFSCYWGLYEISAVSVLYLAA